MFVRSLPCLRGVLRPRQPNTQLLRSCHTGVCLIAAVTCLVVLGANRVDAHTDAALIPRRALFSAADRPVARLSPSGDRVAYIEIQDAIRSIWMASVDEPSERTRIRPSGDGQALSLWWSADGSRLLVQQRLADGVRLYSCDVDSGRSIDLTPISGTTARLEKLSSEMPEHALVALNDRERRVFDLWSINLTTAKRELVIEGTGFRKVHVDAKFKPHVAERLGPQASVELFRKTDERWEPLRKLETDHSNTRRVAGAGVQGVVGIDRTGDTLYLVDNTGRDKSVLLAVNLATGKETVLARDVDADIRPTAVVDRVTGGVLGVSAQFDRLRRYHIERSVRDDFTFLEQHFGQPVGVVGISAQDDSWLVVPFDGGPLRYYVYRRSRRIVQPLFSANRALDGYTMARRYSHVVTTRDGLRLPCHLYLPPGSDGNGDGLPDERLPTLLYVHGGPHVAYPWDSWFTNRCLQLLANRGYAALRVEFRGAGGFGKSFMQQGWRQWGGDIQRDLVDIARWAVDRRIAKKGRIGVWGWSFGGFSAFATLAFYPDEFACGVAMYGLSDLEQFARRVGLVPGGVALRVGDPKTEEGRELLRRQSPVHFAQRVTSPLLITHGGKDRVAPKRQSDLFVEALRRHDKEVTYLVYPDEGHDFRRAESWISFWAVAERFLHEHLGGRYEAAGDDLESANLQIAAGGELVPGLTQPETN